MTTSFYNGISGLKNFQDGIDVWSNNISNINTIGYKENIPEFETLFSNTLSSSPVASDVGMGSSLSSTAIDLTQGSLIKTDNTFDLTVVDNGFFKVFKNGKSYYTKTGNFKFDANRNLVDDNGAFLAVKNGMIFDKQIINGKEYPSVSNNTNDNVSTIQLPQNLIYPEKKTENVTFDTTTDFLKETKFADKNSDFKTLLTNNNTKLNLENNQSLFIGAGTLDFTRTPENKIKTILSVKSGEYVINGIKINIPETSTKEAALKNMYTVLKKYNIEAKIQDNKIVITDPDKLDIKFNDKQLLIAKKIYYKDNPTKNNEFNSVNDFLSLNNDILKNFNTEMNLTSGSFEVCNASDENLILKFLQTDNSNKNLLNQLSPLNSNLKPSNSVSSNVFKTNIENSEFFMTKGTFYLKDNQITKNICLSNNENLKINVDGKELDLSKMNSDMIEDKLNKSHIKYDYDETNNTLTLYANNELIVNNEKAKKFNFLSTYSSLKDFVNNANNFFNTNLVLNDDSSITNNDKTDFSIFPVGYKTSEIKNLENFNNIPILDNVSYQDKIYSNGEKKIEFYILPDTDNDRLIIKIDNKEVYNDVYNSNKITLTDPKMTINLDIENDTVKKINFIQDGEPQGDLLSYEVNDNNIVATFSNNISKVIGTIPIYKFTNNQGLRSIGNNLYTTTSNSGKIIELKDAKILSNTLEQSNVTMNKAMTELIIAQKAFSAAAKTVTTSDQMIQKAIEMKR